jgi:hypothetical protein
MRPTDRVLLARNKSRALQTKEQRMLHTLTAFEKATKIQPAAKTVAGQYLSKNHLDARGRAKFAADLLDGRAILGPLTAKQIIALCRMKPAHVTAARDPGRRKLLAAT